MAPYNPPLAHYAHINLKGFNEAVIQQLIGHRGKGLYDITALCNLRYVWYNHDSQILELWGPYKAFVGGAREKIFDLITAMDAKTNMT